MSTPADQVNRQSPTPTSGGEGQDLRSVANRIEGLLDDDGHFNPDPSQVSRGHPDYDPDTDSRTTRDQERDEKGRFRKKQSEPEIDSDRTADSEATGESADTQGDEQDEDTEQRVEGGDTDEAQPESAVEEAEQDEAETGRIETLTELAEALELPIDELKANISHTFRAAGEDVTVNLAELEAGYQKDADYRRRTSELADARRAAEQDYTLKMQEFEKQHVFTAQTMNAIEQVVTQELNSDALAQLRTSDPAEWSARREEIGQRLATVRQSREQAAAQYQQFRQQQLGELKQRELRSLKERMPDFGQDHVQLARKSMSTLGYSQDEISEIFDHRLVLGALELAALRSEVETLRQEKAKAKDTVRRVKKDIPKLQKPGRQRVQSRSGIRRDSVQRLKERARKSGSVDDAAKVIESMFTS